VVGQSRDSRLRSERPQLRVVQARLSDLAAFLATVMGVSREGRQSPEIVSDGFRLIPLVEIYLLIDTNLKGKC
jgi:hypothetical protein